MLKGVKYPPEPLTNDEVKALISVCGAESSTGLRNRALIVILFRGGLRISEALDLELKDIDPDGTLRVLHGKGDKARTVALDPGAMAIVQLWIARRRELGLSGPLLCTLKGARVKTVYARNLMKRLAKKAGITKRVHCHGLRHSAAVSMLQEGHDLGTISQMLGHSNLVVTNTYVRHLFPERVVNAMRQRSW